MGKITKKDKKELIEVSNLFNTYVNENREKIDESLVSLRLMKEVDDFLCLNNINQRDFARDLEYSEAYISQLMSGTKKFNASFINKLEKLYNIIIEFNIKYKNTKSKRYKISKITEHKEGLEIDKFEIEHTKDFIMCAESVQFISSNNYQKLI